MRPNECKNNVNNNWYANFSCVQCLQNTIDSIEIAAHESPEEYARTRRVICFNYTEEISCWQKIIDRVHSPWDEQQGIFIQDDDYPDKELTTMDGIPASERPISQWWSWDRILHSYYAKQSNMLLGPFLYYENLDCETILRNFRSYKPRTVYESFLSPFVHAILAAWTGGTEEAYCLFLHATRLDLDDYSNGVHQGLHIISMTGSWQVTVRGFAGMKVLDGQPDFNPIIPQAWDSYIFKANLRGCTLQVKIEKQVIKISLLEGHELNIRVSKVIYNLKKGKDSTVPRQK